MKIIVLTDSHANLPALQAALEAIRREGADLIYHTGDAIAIGPHPRECLDLLLSIPHMHLLMGNHDWWFARGLPQPQPEWMSDGEVAHQHWTHARLDPALKNVIAQWPWAIAEEWEGVRVALMHYAPANTPGEFAPTVHRPAAPDADHIFSAYHADLVIYGHTHVAWDVAGQARYVNPGSLGCHTEAVARFVVLSCEKARYTLEYRAVPYDDTSLFHDLEARHVPEREFIRRVFFRRAGL